MAQNYSKMWDAFLGGEWYTGTPLGEDATGDQYLEQTREFYSSVIGPAFGLPGGPEGFGSTDLAGTYATFSETDFERAERDFRSAIGDPYGDEYGDPFSWEKVSRYNTADPAGVGRLQDLLEDQLYGQGKFLGGETGADYGTATAKGLETYSSGIRGERESLTYEGLTGGAGLTSGTGGSVLRSGESTAVAEDILIEAYKKAKALGSDYRAGSEEIEQTLSEDLDTALTTYLEEIDEEKERWFSSVLSNVQTFKTLEGGGDVGDATWNPVTGQWGIWSGEGDVPDYGAMTDQQLEEHMNLQGGNYYNEWSCGYGQTWNPSVNDGEGGCVDTTGEGGYEEEIAGYKFRDDPACGIGELYNEGTEQCELRDDVDLVADDYGFLCEGTEIDECGECGGNSESCMDCAGVPYGEAEPDECGVCGGDGKTVECWDGMMACSANDCSYEPEDVCGVVGGPGYTVTCWDGTDVCDQAECPEDPGGDVLCRIQCPDGWLLDSVLCECYIDSGIPIYPQPPEELDWEDDQF